MPRGKQRTTFAKVRRETQQQERKAAKEQRKEQRREEAELARAEGRELWEAVDPHDDSLDRPDRVGSLLDDA